MATYYGNGTSYTLGAKLKGGGEGDVYDIQGMPDRVAKLYNATKFPTSADRTKQYSKIKTMLKMHVQPYSNGELIIAWPTDYLLDSNSQFVGFVMPKVIGKKSLVWACNMNDRQQLFNGKYTWKHSVVVAYNLAWALSQVHAAGAVVGDMNSNNILVDSSGHITLIDCDSFNIWDASGTEYKCTVGMEEALPAELQGRDLSRPTSQFTVQSDDFALAIHIFNLLCNNCHPFTCPNKAASSKNQNSVLVNITNGHCPYIRGQKGAQDAPDMRQFPDDLMKLFRRAFEYDNNTAILPATISRRPSATEWTNALYPYASDATKVKQCKKDKLHFYPSSYSSCPWCAVQVPPPPPPPPPPYNQKQPIPTPSTKQTNRNRREVWPLYTLCMGLGAVMAALPAKYMSPYINGGLNSITEVGSVSDLAITIVVCIVALVLGWLFAAWASDRYRTALNGWPWLLLSLTVAPAAWAAAFLVALAAVIVTYIILICIGVAVACACCSEC